MNFHIPFSQTQLRCFLFILSLSISPSLSDPRISEAGRVCGTSEESLPNLIPNFTQLMIKLKALVFNQSWGFESINSPPPPINAFAQCHQDLSQNDCAVCFSTARGKVSLCIPSQSGRVYLDGCFIRYDNETILNSGIDPEYEIMKCSPPTGDLDDDYVKTEFAKKVNLVVGNVTKTASMNKGFAVAEVKGGVTNVYALAQCWKTVTDKECEGCLSNATSKVMECVPGSEGRVINDGCFLRYSTQKFFADSMVSHGKSNATIIIACVLGGVAVTLLLFFGAFVGYVRLSKKKEEQNNLSRISSGIDKSNLSFKYETLEKATDFFDSSMKVGQGAAGSVFKGTLPDGRIVAVKRLFYSTRQWVDQFFNEVNLISGIQHKNLVKLLGCSIEGPESLLVFEYVPNGNLDQFLSDMKKRQKLSWQQRISIIFGTADGLAYLHGGSGSGSQVKIIHRDIKSSNILLDENLFPKIADFGLARCFTGDKSHISTGIAGTLGYMAPEYLVRGQLTEKADVYAFGVLSLEIVCGRKNSVFLEGSASILQTVWKHYNSNSLPETVDPCLKDDFLAQEACRVLQIGLLCTQASAALRPSMSEVVQMLNDKETPIPSPKQPPFLNSSVLGTGTGSTSKSLAMNSLALDGEIKAEHTITVLSPESNGSINAEVSSEIEKLEPR